VSRSDKLAQTLLWVLVGVLLLVIACVVISFWNWRFPGAPSGPSPSEQVELSTQPAGPSAVAAEAPAATPQPSTAVTDGLAATPRPSAVSKGLVVTPQPSATSYPTVPPPEDWPTGVPWPPPSLTPPPASTAQPFPTPSIPPLLDSHPGVLQTLWFPHYPAPGSVPRMRAVSVSEQGRQWDQADGRLDLALPVPDARGAYLEDLHPSPDGRWLIADFAHTGSRLVDLSSGEAVDPLSGDLAIGEYRFRAWHPDGQHALVLTTEGLLSVDPASRTHTAIDYYDGPEFEGAQVAALAYSPSVDLLADAVVYPATYGVREVDVVEIGLVRPDGVREPIVQILGGMSVLGHSLKWSPDGQNLIWIARVGPTAAGPVRLVDIETQLWMADFASGDIEVLAVLGRGVEVKYPAVWSPDGRSVAVILGEEGDGNVFSIDVGSGAKQQVTHLAGEQLSHLTWSPDGRLLAFTVSRGSYGEIWAASLDGAQQYPIAGPTFPDAPFVWMAMTGEE
jgi:hypothetical protein